MDSVDDAYQNKVSVKANVRKANAKRSGRNYTVVAKRFFGGSKCELLERTVPKTQSAFRTALFSYVEDWPNLKNALTTTVRLIWHDGTERVSGAREKISETRN